MKRIICCYSFKKNEIAHMQGEMASNRTKGSSFLLQALGQFCNTKFPSIWSFLLTFAEFPCIYICTCASIALYLILLLYTNGGI